MRFVVTAVDKDTLTVETLEGACGRSYKIHKPDSHREVGDILTGELKGQAYLFVFDKPIPKDPPKRSCWGGVAGDSLDHD